MFAADEAEGGGEDERCCHCIRESNGQPAKDIAFRGHMWLVRGAWGCCLLMMLVVLVLLQVVLVLGVEA